MKLSWILSSNLAFIVSSIALLTSCTPQRALKTKNFLTTADSIDLALEYQMEHYPVSQYIDVYKNFMQDFFGPGHHLKDTAASDRYLRYELSQESDFEGPIYEPTGYQGNFYRVNLSVIREGLVPYETFFNSFVESVQGIVPPTDEDWKRKWGVIDSIIIAKDIHFYNETDDRETLKRQFEEGDFIVHHSQRYNDSVRFHYRIISRANFLRDILPLLLSDI